jgi:CopG-like RHH_1 or ribbon-helix-helix domain, RHH_5
MYRADKPLIFKEVYMETGLQDVPTRKPRISVVVDEELLKYLEQWADSEERSLSNLVLKVIKDAVEERERKGEDK